MKYGMESTVLPGLDEPSFQEKLAGERLKAVYAATPWLGTDLLLTERRNGQNTDKLVEKTIIRAHTIGRLAFFAGISAEVDLPGEPVKTGRWRRKQAEVPPSVGGWLLDIHGRTTPAGSDENVPIFSATHFVLGADGYIHGMRFNLDQVGNTVSLDQHVVLDDNTDVSELFLYGTRARPDSFTENLDRGLARFVVQHNLDGLVGPAPKDVTLRV